jgi:DNA-binding transcriptional regulator YiaG
MDKAQKIKELRESTGMNRKEFCEYFDIPYRTVTEWERGMRHAPDYVIRLLAYYIEMEKMMKVEELEVEKIDHK